MRDPDALRSRSGIRGDPNQDQHFLIDDRVLDRIPGYAADFDCSHILEIGAGTGALTDRLLTVGDTVTVIERDTRLVDFLVNEFAKELSANRLVILKGDVLTINIPDFTVSISNLPYSIVSPVLFRLLPRKRPLICMVQQEFAERLIATPGTAEYGRLSITAQHYAQIELVERVPRTAFDPQPAVDSAIVRSIPQKPDYDVPDEEFFFQIVTAVFTQRRKTLRNALRNTTHISRISNPARVLDTLDASLLQSRPGELTPSDYAEIARIAIDTAHEPD